MIIIVYAFYIVDDLKGPRGNTVTHSIAPPKQHITYASILKSGSYKGQLRVDFDKIITDNETVEIQIAPTKYFASDEVLSYKVTGKDVSSKYIKFSKQWNSVWVYIRVRNIVKNNGTTYYGEWSDISATK